MSLKLNSSGGGSVTLQEPSTASNLTLTLPAVTGTVLTTSTVGTVLQVVSTNKTDTFSTTSGTYVDVTGLSVSITPTSTTSKIYVVVTLGFCAAAGTRAAFQLVRGSTAVGVGDASGSRTTASSSGGTGSPATMESTSFSFFDSPSTTSSTTYKVQTAFIDASGTLYINRTVNDDDAASRPRTSSTITVMEIAA